MANPFVAEIRIFPFNFAPKGWAFCRGQLLPISQNTALFSLLGTNFGGDGKSTFGLPNLLNLAVVNAGSGAGLSQYFIGEENGAPPVTLSQAENPTHGHFWMATSTDGSTLAASNNQLAKAFGGNKQGNYTANYLSTNAPQTALSQ